MKIRSNKSKKIFLVGGGSGGHLTPLVAVAEKLKDIDSSCKLVYIGQKHEDLQNVIEHSVIDENYSISAGKFRRYHGESILKHVLDFKTLFLNSRDIFRFGIGTIQAWRLIGKEKPDVIFLKGGFVSVPVGIAARFRNVPYITHDSDAIPGLANRLTAKHAVYNTVAMPIEGYPYDQSKTIQVGTPVQSAFSYVSSDDMQTAKKDLSLRVSDPVLFSVGGGLGAEKLNSALVDASQGLLNSIPGLQIIHLTGKKLFADVASAYKDLGLDDKVAVIDFTTELYTYSAAADVVLTRAGATNMAEFSLQAKACVIVPAPHLTGGQQLHNARLYEDNDAAIVLQEKNLHGLQDKLVSLLTDKKMRETLSTNIYKLSIPDGAEKIARILMDIEK